MAEAADLGLDKGFVVGAELGQDGVGELEVGFGIVAEVGGALTGQEGVAAPGGAVEQGGHIR